MGQLSYQNHPFYFTSLTINQVNLSKDMPNLLSLIKQSKVIKSRSEKLAVSSRQIKEVN